MLLRPWIHLIHFILAQHCPGATSSSNSSVRASYFGPVLANMRRCHVTWKDWHMFRSVDEIGEPGSSWKHCLGVRCDGHGDFYPKFGYM